MSELGGRGGDGPITVGLECLDCGAFREDQFADHATALRAVAQHRCDGCDGRRTRPIYVQEPDPRRAR